MVGMIVGGYAVAAVAIGIVVVRDGSDHESSVEVVKLALLVAAIWPVVIGVNVWTWFVDTLLVRLAGKLRVTSPRVIAPSPVALDTLEA